jgi:hypothetical protein
MYNITFTYIRPNRTSETKFPYVVLANSYDEAIALIQVEANKRIENFGGTIVSII